MKVRWTRRAWADLQPIARHIAEDNPPAAARFTRLLAVKVAVLQEHPLLGRHGAFEDTRELVVHRNCLVTYRVRGDEVQVIQVWHVARGLPRGGQ